MEDNIKIVLREAFCEDVSLIIIL